MAGQKKRARLQHLFERKGRVPYCPRTTSRKTSPERMGDRGARPNGPYSRSTRGKRFILVATDTFSRWIEAFPIRKATIGNHHTNPRERGLSAMQIPAEKSSRTRANQEAYVPTEPEEGPNPPRIGNLLYNRNHPLSDVPDK
jgi:hypothetical protein